LDYVPNHPNLWFEAADIVNPPAITAALKNFGPDTVFHLASESDGAESGDHMRACVHSNTAGTLNTLEASVASGAKLFVYADSSKVYGNGPVPFHTKQPEDPICSYAIAKAAGWKLCKLLAAREEIKLAGLRPTFVYGPRQNFNLISYIEQSVKTNQAQAIRIQGGKQTRDLVYIDDVIRCFACVMHASGAWGQSFPIGGGREISVSDLSREILDVLSSDAHLIEEGDPLRPTEIFRSYCDNLQIKQACGWSPRVGLREGLRRTLLPHLYPAQTSLTLRAIAG
jgi:UDP-glucose 4-epimerase